jgi:protein-disulfide isomerase
MLATVPCGAEAPSRVLSAKDLDDSLRQRIARIDETVAAARQAALEAQINERLYELEAERRKIPARDLYYEEVVSKSGAVTEAEAKAEYESDRDRWGAAPFEEQRVRLAAMLSDRHETARAAEYAKELRARFPVVMKDDPHGAVLATVSGRQITASQMATLFDAAEYSARFALWRDSNRSLVAMKGKSAASIDLPEPARPRVTIQTGSAPSRGETLARVTVVEFADFQCPPCGKTWSTIEDALAPYGKRVRYVFMNNPLRIHEFAMKAAEAGLAANAQGKFFEYADLLFRNQSALDVASLEKYAATAGLDAKRFSSDLAAGRFAPAVVEQRRAAARYGAIGTPAVFINGVRLPNTDLSVEGIRAAVDAQLLGK